MADVEANAKPLRDKKYIFKYIFESQILDTPAAGRVAAVAKVRHVLEIDATGLAPADTHHRKLVAVVLADLTQLAET